MPEDANTTIQRLRGEAKREADLEIAQMLKAAAHLPAGGLQRSKRTPDIQPEKRTMVMPSYDYQVLEDGQVIETLPSQREADERAAALQNEFGRTIHFTTRRKKKEDTQ